jgi:nucleolar complex protein 2
MLAPFEKLTRRTVRAAAAAFGSDTASASDAAPSTDPSGAPRVQALLLLRACMLLLPSPTPETALRSAYRAYVQNAKFVSAASVAHLGFMAAGLVELVGAASPDDAYTCAFGAVRELALLARTALAAQKADSFREVYCWQTVNCLELWARVLAAHCGVGAAAAGGNGNNAATPKTAGTKTRPPQKSLAPLVYPLTQVLLVAARLVPTPRYFPLRLRLCRALSRLAQATGFYVPLSAALVEMLEWAELRRKPAGASSKNKGKGAASKNAARAPDMMLQLRLSKASLRSPALQEEVVAQVVEALSDHLSQWSTSVAFPELSVVPVAALRKFVKRCPVERFRKSVKGLADALERNAAWVGSARDAVSFAPHDLASAGAFLAGSEARAPLAQYAAPLLRKAAARMALRSALPGAAADGGAVAALVGGGGSRSERRAALNEDRDEEGDDDDEDEDEMEARAAAAAKRAKGGVVVVGGGAKKKADEAAAAARKAGGERESSDDEEDGAKRGGGAFAEGDEDEVGDYELSESGDEEGDDEDEPMEEEEEDEEEEEAPRPARGGGGRGGGGRGRGGGGRGRGRGRGPRR